jgi:hypothetical protein
LRHFPDDQHGCFVEIHNVSNEQERLPTAPFGRDSVRRLAAY